MAGDVPVKHTLRTTNGGALILKTILSQPGWYKGKGVDIIYGAGETAQNLSHLKDEGKEEWSKGDFSLELSEGQREACKHCLRHFLQEGALGINQHVMSLVKQLGIESTT